MCVVLASGQVQNLDFLKKFTFVAQNPLQLPTTYWMKFNPLSIKTLLPTKNLALPKFIFIRSQRVYSLYPEFDCLFQPLNFSLISFPHLESRLFLTFQILSRNLSRPSSNFPFFLKGCHQLALYTGPEFLLCKMRFRVNNF